MHPSAGWRKLSGSAAAPPVAPAEHTTTSAGPATFWSTSACSRVRRDAPRLVDCYMLDSPVASLILGRHQRPPIHRPRRPSGFGKTRSPVAPRRARPQPADRRCRVDLRADVPPPPTFRTVHARRPTGASWRDRGGHLCSSPSPVLRFARPARNGTENIRKGLGLGPAGRFELGTGQRGPVPPKRGPERHGWPPSATPPAITPAGGPRSLEPLPQAEHRETGRRRRPQRSRTRPGQTELRTLRLPEGSYQHRPLRGLLHRPSPALFDPRQGQVAEKDPTRLPRGRGPRGPRMSDRRQPTGTSCR